MAELKMDYFYISMHDIMRMHILDSITDTMENTSDHLFIVEFVLSDVVKKGSIFSIL